MQKHIHVSQVYICATRHFQPAHLRGAILRYWYYFRFIYMLFTPFATSSIIWRYTPGEYDGYIDGDAMGHIDA